MTPGPLEARSRQHVTTLPRGSHLFLSLSTPRSSRPHTISYEMTSSAHASYHTRISFDPAASSPAPVEEGQISGYFNDSLSRTLLGLTDNEQLLHSGTYGSKEPGQFPTAFSLIREGPRDRRFLPFVPQRYSDSAFPFSMHDRNGQYLVHVKLLQSRREELDRLAKAILDVSADMGRSPPDYLRALIPRVTYEWQSSTMIGAYQTGFPYQFQPYFTPSANRARWIRIWRLLALGQGFLNLCATALGSRTTQQRPTGILLDCSPRDEDIPLLRAFLRLGVSIEGECPELSLVGFTEVDALQLLLGPRSEDNLAGAFSPSTELEPTDDDGLVWSVFNEDYDKKVYDDFGYAQTRRYRRIERAEQAREAAQADENDEDEYMAGYHLAGEAAPSEQAATRELVLYEAGLRRATPSMTNLQVPSTSEHSAGPSTPTSTSGQTSTSTSSRNRNSEGGTPYRRPRQNNRSREFQGVPRAPKRKSGSKGSRFSGANQEPLGGSSSHYRPYPPSHRQHDSASSASREPSQPGSTMTAPDLALLAEALVPASRQAPFRAGPALAARQSRELFRDTDTGTLHPMRVTETSFSALGLASEPAYSTPSSFPADSYAPGAATMFPPHAQAGANNPNWTVPPGASGPDPASSAGWGETEPFGNPFMAPPAPSTPSYPPPSGPSARPPHGRYPGQARGHTRRQ